MNLVVRNFIIKEQFVIFLTPYEKFWFKMYKKELTFVVGTTCILITIYIVSKNNKFKVVVMRGRGV